MTNALSVNDLKGASVQLGGSVEAGYEVGLDLYCGESILSIGVYVSEKNLNQFVRLITQTTSFLQASCGMMIWGIFLPKTGQTGFGQIVSYLDLIIRKNNLRS